MAKKLKIDTGVVEYDLNGVAKARFNPTDPAFIERFYKTFEDLEARQAEFQQRVDEIGEDGAAMFAYATERDEEMRGIVDSLLGEGVAGAVFAGMNCYALADGLPVWVNLMFAIAEEIADATEKEQAKGDPRVKNYSKKYEAMAKKYRKKK